MLIENTIRANMLCDFYGTLLSERQHGVVNMYYANDMSLSEIALDMGISRQAVHNILKKAVGELERYESKLSLLSKFCVVEQATRMVKDEIMCLAAERRGDKALYSRLQGIYGAIEQIEAM
ncbi:MAG: hypothetical protein LBH39_07050 [Clostridiales Family XIII bacterium]|jgi:predicted DNA-binding protein YlxM (UPF0122 family)|nr:hypothetical protein [Clostridiales Family XIII bacterium]